MDQKSRILAFYTPHGNLSRMSYAARTAPVKTLTYAEGQGLQLLYTFYGSKMSVKWSQRGTKWYQIFNQEYWNFTFARACGSV